MATCVTELSQVVVIIPSINVSKQQASSSRIVSIQRAFKNTSSRFEKLIILSKKTDSFLEELGDL